MSGGVDTLAMSLILDATGFITTGPDILVSNGIAMCRSDFYASMSESVGASRGPGFEFSAVRVCSDTGDHKGC